MSLDAESEELIRLHYRWWTVSADRSYIKLGPLSVAWFRLGDHFWIQAIWNGRHLRTIWRA